MTSPNSRRRLNPDDVQQLAAAGLTRSEIADRLGCSLSGVKYIARRDGIHIQPAERRPYEVSAFWLQNDPVLSQMRAAGKRPSEIARQIGTTKNAVIGRMHRLGLCGKGRQRNDSAFWGANSARVQSMRDAGMSYVAIAQEIGCSKGAVRHRLILLRARGISSADLHERCIAARISWRKLAREASVAERTVSEVVKGLRHYPKALPKILAAIERLEAAAPVRRLPAPSWPEQTGSDLRGMCFAAHNIQTRTTGRIAAVATHVPAANVLGGF